MEHLHHNVRTATVWLWRDRWNRPQSHCDCGWKGRPRWFRIDAIAEAWTHTHCSGHMPTQPMDKWKAARRGTFAADLHAALWLVGFIAIMAVALGYSVVPS
jgi:hypothetical protein